MTQGILELVKHYEEKTRELRRYFHQHPELSSKEIQTGAFIKEKCHALGLTVEDVPVDQRSKGTGFIATLDTGRPGKTIALRTDIDALPVQENACNLAQKRTVISQTDGVMHACGHDGHMAILLTTMQILHDLKDQLSGKIIFIFEEAEETANSIHAMVDFLQGRGIDAIYGNHLAAFLDTGLIACDPGQIMTGIDMINFDVVGQGGHGSRPDLARNPIYAGVDILNSISVVWNNQIDIEKTVTLGITQFNAGSQDNVFPDRAHIAGTLRFFDEAEGRRAYDLLMDTARRVAPVHGCRIEEGEVAGFDTLPVVNDEDLALKVQSQAEELFPGHLVHDLKWYASETFAHYSLVAPSVFSFVGIRNKELGSGAEHHNEYFDLDEAALKYGVALMTSFAYHELTADD